MPYILSLQQGEWNIIGTVSSRIDEILKKARTKNTK